MAKSRKKNPTKAPSPSVHFIKRWLDEDVTAMGPHSLILMSESIGTRPCILDELRATVSDHYVDPETTAKQIMDLGAPKTAQRLREHLPTTKTARSGDLGEVLATEVAEQHLGFEVPIRRLRWKDGRNTALRGDDIIGLAWKKKKLVFLKGEAKSRISLSAAVLKKAGDTLNSCGGRPDRHSVLFMTDRLWEQGKDESAKKIETAYALSSTGVEHMLFALTGSNPKKLLTEHLKTNSKKRRRLHAIGLHIEDHVEFIKALFEEI